MECLCGETFDDSVGQTVISICLMATILSKIILKITDFLSSNFVINTLSIIQLILQNNTFVTGQNIIRHRSPRKQNTEDPIKMTAAAAWDF